DTMIVYLSCADRDYRAGSCFLRLRSVSNVTFIQGGLAAKEHRVYKELNH
ncbi:MAG: hypothetical protein JWM99_43, partial [Verrucomicrobiales bacterium]|nr:hypothetical protein [Verrucomicrobiales bacterium]